MIVSKTDSDKSGIMSRTRILVERGSCISIRNVMSDVDGVRRSNVEIYSVALMPVAGDLKGMDGHCELCQQSKQCLYRLIPILSVSDDRACCL